MVETGSLQLPAISKESVDHLLYDVGLTPEGKEAGDDDGLTIGLYDRAKLMAREQAMNVKAANPELLRRVHKASALNYPDSENYRRVFTIGSMAVIRACGYELKESFALYLQGIDTQALDTFELYLACATPLTTRADILDEVLNGPEIPHFQIDLLRALRFMSLFSIDSDHADKFRVGSACTYLAVDHTWDGVVPGPDRVKSELGLAEMEKRAHIIEEPVGRSIPSSPI